MNEAWASPSHKKIAIILGTRYPTEKAYGVTTAYSAKEASSLGYQVSIISPETILNQANEVFTTRAQLVNLRVFLGKFLQRAFNFNLFGFNRIAFWLHRSFFIKSVLKFLYAQNFGILWVRDLVIAKELIKMYPKSKLILELHGPISKIDFSLLVSLTMNENLILAPINPSAFHRLQELGLTNNTVYSPMGVDLDRFSDTSPRILQKTEKRTILYLGKFTSLGKSNGLEVLISAAKLSQEKRLDLQIKLVGGTDIDVHRLKQFAAKLNISQEFLEITGAINFDSVGNLQSEADCLVIPYPTIPQFESFFPIKLFEYAASRRPVICSDSKYLRNIVLEDCVTFFQEGNGQSLVDAITTVLDPINASLIRSKIEKFASLSSEFTWKERTRKILNQKN